MVALARAAERRLDSDLDGLRFDELHVGLPVMIQFSVRTENVDTAEDDDSDIEDWVTDPVVPR